MQDLSPREEQVIWLVAQGNTTNEIAKILYIAEITARNHIQHILAKTETNSRIAAVHAWRNRKPDHAGRILDYCSGAGIRLTGEQVAGIKAMFEETAQCEDGAHKIPPGEASCECKLLTTVVPGVSLASP